MKTRTGMKSQKQQVINCLIPTAFVIIRLTSRIIPCQQMHLNNCTKRVIFMTLFLHHIHTTTSVSTKTNQRGIYN